MKLSALEQSSLSEGSSAAQAISNTVALSKELDRLGYSRIWVSEHHNLNILQGSTPEVLLGAIGAQTTRIRLGSGGVMLPNHSAYHIAENFRTLEALYPGRVDCGIGRASGGDSYSRSLLVPTPDAWGDFGDRRINWRAFFTTLASVLLPCLRSRALRPSGCFPPAVTQTVASWRRKKVWGWPSRSSSIPTRAPKRSDTTSRISGRPRSSRSQG